VPSWRTPSTPASSCYRAPIAKNGYEAWAEVIAHDYEGLLANDEASLYEAGPTRRWLKVKQRGWTDTEDRWRRRISTRA